MKWRRLNMYWDRVIIMFQENSGALCEEYSYVSQKIKTSGKKISSAGLFCDATGAD